MRFRKIIGGLLPHLTIILAGMFLVFCIIDRFNTAMHFIDSSLSKGLLFVFCLSALATAALLVAKNRRGE